MILIQTKKCYKGLPFGGDRNPKKVKRAKKDSPQNSRDLAPLVLDFLLSNAFTIT